MYGPGKKLLKAAVKSVSKAKKVAKPFSISSKEIESAVKLSERDRLKNMFKELDKKSGMKKGGSTGMDKYQTKGQVKPVKKSSTTPSDKYKEEKEKSFKRDSTNLTNAALIFKRYSEKYPGYTPGQIAGDEWWNSRDSIYEISKRRQGDKEFWDKMNRKKGGSTGMTKYQKKGEVKPVKKPSTTTFNKYGETANKAMYRMTGTDTIKNQYAYDKSGKMIKVKKMGGMVKSKKK